MQEYTEECRMSDFNFFINHYLELFEKYGHKFLAIKNHSVIGVSDTVGDVIVSLSNDYEVGTYIIQECTGDESSYKTSIMRLKIRG